MLTWLKHAFAVEPAGSFSPTEREAVLVDRLARAVVRRRLTSPAVLALDCSPNLNFLGSQVLVFFAPIAKLIFNPADYDAFAGFLERRGSVEYLSRRIELFAEDDPGPDQRGAGAEDRLETKGGT